MLYFDNDMRFDAKRLKTLVEQRIHKACADSRVDVPASADRAVRDCLARFEVIRPKDSFQMQASLVYMGRVLQQQPRVKVLMIDSGSAFYYLDRNEDDNNQFKSTNRVVHLITQMRMQLGLCCFVTKGQIREGQIRESQNARMRGEAPEKDCMYSIYSLQSFLCEYV